jgi:hypothetical protein
VAWFIRRWFRIYDLDLKAAGGAEESARLLVHRERGLGRPKVVDHDGRNVGWVIIACVDVAPTRTHRLTWPGLVAIRSADHG